MRPSLRRAAVVLAVLAALALSVRLAVVSYAERRLERAREAYREAIGPLDLESLELPEIPDERNAASWILRAAEADDLIPWDARLGRLAARPASSWVGTDVDLARGLVGQREEALALLSRARSAGSSTFGIRYRDGFNAKIPDLIAVTRVAKLEVVAGRLALAEGSAARLTASLETLDAVAAALCRESTLITLLIGSAVERLGTALLAERLARGGGADLDLEARLAARAGPGCGRQALRRALTAEAMVVETAPEAQASMRRRLGWQEGLLDWAFRQPTAALMPAVGLEVRRRLIENLSLSFAEYEARWEAGEFFSDRLARGYDLAAPNLIAAIGNVKATETAAALARAALTAALEHRRTGRFPEALALEPTAYGGEVPDYAFSERAAEIGAPRSEALWQQRHPGGGHQPLPPTFRWRVTAEAAGTAPRS